jgi:hypothetical protein
MKAPPSSGGPDQVRMGSPGAAAEAGCLPSVGSVGAERSRTGGGPRTA